LATVIIPMRPQMRKTSVEAVPPSTLTIMYDVNIPAGTLARAEMSFTTGLFQPHLFKLEADPEVQGEVYILQDSSEVKLLEIDEDSAVEVDVDEEYGELLTTMLILKGVTKTTTTDTRKIVLQYTGGIYQYRIYEYKDLF
jgi:hypothetical protein